MFINEALASSAGVAGGASSLSGTFIQLALILFIFYIFLIRPQQKRMRAHFDLVNALKINDKVVTSSGVYGTVKKIYEQEIDLEIAPNVVIKIERMSVSMLVNTEKKSAEKVLAKNDEKVEKSAKKSVKKTNKK